MLVCTRSLSIGSNEECTEFGAEAKTDFGVLPRGCCFTGFHLFERPRHERLSGSLCGERQAIVPYRSPPKAPAHLPRVRFELAGDNG
jgi:hypothetical protein